MAFTYSPTLATSKDVVRFLVGDADPGDPLLQDEEIAWVLTQVAEPYHAAAVACQSIVGSLSKQVSTAIGQTKLALEQRAASYRMLVNELRTQAALMSPGLPYAGGISVSDKFTVASDLDRVPPFVTGATDFDPAVPATAGTPVYPPGYGGYGY